MSYEKIILPEGRKDINTNVKHILEHISRILLEIISNESNFPKEYFCTKLESTLVSVDFKVVNCFTTKSTFRSLIKTKYINLINIVSLFSRPDGISWDQLESGGVLSCSALEYIKFPERNEKEFFQTLDMEDNEFELWFKLNY